MKPFSLSHFPRIEFGAGVRRHIPALARQYGTQILLITGRKSFYHSPFWPELEAEFVQLGIDLHKQSIAGEPSPDEIDAIVKHYHPQAIDAVIGIGGGSALDAAKAVAGLLRPGNSVKDHLEGVGPELPYKGPSVPFIAVPTTAGTGSEATKNAVLSTQGPNGYKKSFRSEQLIAAYAIVDPDFLATCPPHVMAGNGMDALTQLLESYVSIRANPFCDALALSGLECARNGLLALVEDPQNATAQAAMAYAATVSGITLAQVGLGVVHGFASPLGAFFPIPHGLVCGTLVAAATEINIRALRERAPDSEALRRYAKLGRLLNDDLALADTHAQGALVELLYEWTRHLQLPKLGELGVKAEDHARIIANSRGSSMKTNPLVLTDEELQEILLICQ